MKEKSLYIIAGCNGAGKTTASYTILPEIIACKEFVNADEIAKGLSPFQPEKVAFEAGRICTGKVWWIKKICMNKGKNKIEHDEFTKKVLKGLELAYERLIEFKKQKNSELVVMRDGEIVKIKPEELEK